VDSLATGERGAHAGAGAEERGRGWAEGEIACSRPPPPLNPDLHFPFDPRRSFAMWMARSMGPSEC
jgi:hypothetical protein